MKGIMHASTLVLLVTSPINAILSYLLVHRTRLAFLGAPLAMSITYHLSFLLIVAYARWGPAPSHSDDKNVLRRTPSSASLPGTPDTGLISNGDFQTSNNTPKVKNSSLTIRGVFAPAPMFGFLRLALPGILMVATEWWAFEIVALAAGRLGRLSLAAQSVVMTADQSGYHSHWDPAYIAIPSNFPLF
jgi:MATE family, multidrug and toxin extrusion protein